MCAILFNRTQDLHFLKNSGKIVTTAPFSELYSQNLYHYFAKWVYCMLNIVRFHAVESKIKLPLEFWEKQNSRAPYWDTYTQTASLLFLMMHILYINICVISFIRNRDQLIPKISEKLLPQRYLLSDFHQKLTEINLC